MPPIRIKYAGGLVLEARQLFFSATSFVAVWLVLSWMFPGNPLAVLAAGLGAATLGALWWDSRVGLSDEDREDDKYPREYTREREFQGYDIIVHVSEYFSDEDMPYSIQRHVEATATDGEDTIATEESTAYAGTLPETVYDSSVGEGNNGTSAGQQTREVLEDLYDDLLTHDATGSVEESAGVESALDVVFGESK